MNKLRKWIINKLGGFTIDDVKFKEVVNDYWDKECVTASFLISPTDYTKEHADDMEHELAMLLSEKILKKGCIMFHGPCKYDDCLRVEARCVALKIHKRESYHSPDHLVFPKEK